MHNKIVNYTMLYSSKSNYDLKCSKSDFKFQVNPNT